MWSSRTTRSSRRSRRRLSASDHQDQDADMNLEPHNLRQIEQLNQRGGRTLSIVDLIEAGTLSVEMAACAMRAMAEGASLLTGARPGGAGKSTLMGAILGLMPPEVPIVTVEGTDVIQDGLARPASEPACYLAHEIGSGHWYGYIWGPDVADFFSLIDGRRRISSCLHADTLGELKDILRSSPLRIEEAAVGRVGLILFIHVIPGPGARRRVVSLWEADGRGGHRQVYRWNATSDTFEVTGQPHESSDLERYKQFVQALVDQGEAEMEAVRRQVVEFYRDGQ